MTAGIGNGNGNTGNREREEGNKGKRHYRERGKGPRVQREQGSAMICLSPIPNKMYRCTTFTIIKNQSMVGSSLVGSSFPISIQLCSL